MQLPGAMQNIVPVVEPSSTSLLLCHEHLHPAPDTRNPRRLVFWRNALQGARNDRCPRHVDVFRRELFDAPGRRCAGLRNSFWPPHLAASETFVPSTNALSLLPWASQGPTQDDASDRLIPCLWNAMAMMRSCWSVCSGGTSQLGWTSTCN